MKILDHVSDFASRMTTIQTSVEASAKKAEVESAKLANLETEILAAYKEATGELARLRTGPPPLVELIAAMETEVHRLAEKRGAELGPSLLRSLGPGMQLSPDGMYRPGRPVLPDSIRFGEMTRSATSSAASASLRQPPSVRSVTPSVEK